MKTLTTLFLFAMISAAGVLAQSAPILDDYRAKAKIASAKLEETLHKQGTAAAAELVKNGDTAGAATVSAQIEDKLAGRVVETPHASIAVLLAQYEIARAKALKPIQTASIAKIDSLLKSSAGKDMKNVVDLAKAREEIEGGKIPIVATDTLPMLWDYSPVASMKDINGELVLQNDGTLKLKARAGVNFATPGRWEKTDKPNTLKITLDTGGAGEICEMRIKGNDAELERAVGVRYLRAK